MDISRYISFRGNLLSIISDIFLLTGIGYLLLWLGYIVYENPKVPAFLKNSPETIVAILFLLYLVSLFFVFKILLNEAFLLLKRKKYYIYRSNDWPDKWIISGRPEQVSSTELFIKSSRAGCLLKNCYWKDFKMSFEMKWVDHYDQKLGVVFRAMDLDNYFMLELSNKVNTNEVRPHIRYRGGWDVIYPNITTSAFAGTDYIKVELEVYKNTAILIVNGNLETVWVLPTHLDVMYRESGSEGNIQKTDPDEKYVREIPFRDKPGMIGFRSHPMQGAVVRNLRIEAK